MKISIKSEGLTKKHYKELHDSIIAVEYKDIMDASVCISGDDIVINTDNLTKKELDSLEDKLHKTIDKVLDYAKDKKYEDDAAISATKIITVYNNAYKRREENDRTPRPIVEHNSAVNGISNTINTIIYSFGYSDSLVDNSGKVEICTTVKDFLLKGKSGLYSDMIADRDYAMQVLASARLLIHNSYCYADVDIYSVLSGVATIINNTTVFDYEFMYIATINGDTDIYYMKRKE